MLTTIEAQTMHVCHGHPTPIYFGGFAWEDTCPLCALDESTGSKIREAQEAIEERDQLQTQHAALEVEVEALQDQLDRKADIIEELEALAIKADKQSADLDPTHPGPVRSALQDIIEKLRAHPAVKTAGLIRELQALL